MKLLVLFVDDLVAWIIQLLKCFFIERLNFMLALYEKLICPHPSFILLAFRVSCLLYQASLTLSPPFSPLDWHRPICLPSNSWVFESVAKSYKP